MGIIICFRISSRFTKISTHQTQCVETRWSTFARSGWFLCSSVDELGGSDAISEKIESFPEVSRYYRQVTDTQFIFNFRRRQVYQQGWKFFKICDIHVLKKARKSWQIWLLTELLFSNTVTFPSTRFWKTFPWECRWEKKNITRYKRGGKVTLHDFF